MALIEEEITTITKPRVGDMHDQVTSVKVKTSVIVAVNNLEQELEAIYNSLAPSLEQLDKQFEIIFVDDGSEDGTWNVLKGIALSDARVKLIRMRTSFGEAAAFDAGFKQSHGENIVFFTARVRINPAKIPTLISKLDSGYDLVMGWRHPRRDSSLNQFISKIFNGIIKWASKVALHDINSGIFVSRREVLENIEIYGNLNIFLPILAAGKGFTVGDQEIEQLPGKFRQSRYLSEYIHRLLDMISVLFLTKYSKKPLHFLGFIGLVFTLVGAGMNIYLFIYRVFQFGPIAGRPLLLLGALLLVIGLQMISIGLIGEMIIFTHAKQIKEYTIEEILE